MNQLPEADPRSPFERLLGSWWPFVVVAILGLLYTPVRGSFTLVEPTCRWTMGWSDWHRVVANPEHVVPFGILFALAVGRFERAPAAKAAALVMAFAFLMELTQGAFRTGHCRLWDWLADGLGVLLAAIAWALWRRRRP